MPQAWGERSEAPAPHLSGEARTLRGRWEMSAVSIPTILIRYRKSGNAGFFMYNPERKEY